MDTVVNVAGKFYHSSPIKKVFATKPLPAEKLVAPLADDQEFVWKRSMSPSVSKYKFKIKKDDEKATDFWVEDTEQKYDVYHQNEVKFKVPFEFQDSVEYKINIYSVIEHEGYWIESEPLHGKATKAVDNSEEGNTDDERKPIITLARNPKNIKLGRKPSVKQRKFSQNLEIEGLVDRLNSTKTRTRLFSD